MEQRVHESHAEAYFPDPDSVVYRKVALWETAIANLVPHLKSLLFRLRLLATFIVVGLLVEFCSYFGFFV